MNSPINQKTLDVFERLSALCQEIDDKIFFVIFGGWAIDGYVGKITRHHPDIDCICWRKDMATIKRSLTNLGYHYEEVGLPQESDFIYKIVTNDKIITFQIIDKKPDEQFEISFYRFPYLLYPVKYLEPTMISLDKVNYPVVKKEFLITLKQAEVDFYKKEKKNNPEKYNSKHQEKNFNCEQDINLLMMESKTN